MSTGNGKVPFFWYPYSGKHRQLDTLRKLCSETVPLGKAWMVWVGSSSGLCSFLIYKEDMNMVHLTGLQGIKRDISGKQVFLYCQVCSKHSPILPPGRTRSRCSGHAAVLGFETLRVVLPPPFPPAVPSRAASVRLPEVRSCHSVARKSNFLNRVKSWAQRTLPDLSTLPFFWHPLLRAPPVTSSAPHWLLRFLGRALPGAHELLSPLPAHKWVLPEGTLLTG